MGATHLQNAPAPEAWLRRLVRTTPGVIGAIVVVVAATCVTAGLVCGAQLDARIAKVHTVLDVSEPLAYSAQMLYAALSAADASAASTFLSAGIETAQTRARYQRALADAASALTDTTAGAVDTDTRRTLAETSAQLITYTGLVELAEANNRQEFVVGSSYFREASALMQTSLLPGAKKVFTRNLATLDEDQRAASSPPIASFVMLGVALAAIIVGAVVLVGRTNRLFNLGLVVAAFVMVVVSAWIVVVTHMAAGEIEQSRSAGTVTLGRLGNARIATEQARVDETLELIAHTDITSGEASFAGHLDELSALLASEPSVAADAVTKWTVAHGKQIEAYNSGNYLGAVAQAIGTDPDGSAEQFERLQTNVGNEIESVHSSLRAQVSAAGVWLAWSPTGTLALTMVAAAAAIIGLWPRLKEYQ